MLNKLCTCLLLLAGCSTGVPPVAPSVSAAPAVPGLPASRPTFAATARRADATYTVTLRVFAEPNHAEVASTWRKRLSEALGWKDLTVVTQEEYSVLYWGRFTSINAAGTTLAKARAYRDQRGNAHFANAQVTVLPGSDPGEAAWDLHRNPGQFSLLVADFENVPEQGYVGRMKDAVAYCRELRQRGLEAYYYHGPSTSSVTIGGFGPEALREEQRQMPNPLDNQPVIVTRRVVVSPELLALQQQFPHRLWNLHQVKDVVRGRDGRVVSQTVPPSVPVRVPGKGDEQDHDSLQENARPGQRQSR